MTNDFVYYDIINLYILKCVLNLLEIIKYYGILFLKKKNFKILNPLFSTYEMWSVNYVLKILMRSFSRVRRKLVNKNVIFESILDKFKLI